MSIFYTYILKCSDNTYYTGSTKDITARVKKHNSGHGAIYTKYRRPVKLMYFEEFKTQKEAMQREVQIKSWRRKKKENLFTVGKTLK